jgi:signal transduction histidine kinase
VGDGWQDDDSPEKEGVIAQRNLIRELFQRSPGFVAMVSGRAHLVEFANDACTSLVGDRDVVGRPIREALPELEGQAILGRIDDAYFSGTSFAGREIRLMLVRGAARDLETRYVDIACQPIRRGDAVVGILIDGYDVTEQVAAREELVSLRSELIHVSRVGAMSAMAATLAHELNQPLTAIKAYVTGANRCLDQGIEGMTAMRVALVGATAASTRAGEIIKHLRKMVSRGEPEIEVGDLGQMVREAMSLALLGLPAEDVSMSLGVAETIPVAVDRVQIQQVVINLLHNAVAATIACSRREIHVKVSRLGDAAVIEVDDSGMGIAPAIADEIFVPLFTTKAAGLGVGLAISRTIVEAHTGKIWASDSPLGGARFNVLLPLALH